MNWDDTRIFLALTRAPSLRAAARSLGVDQATVGLRLNALEAELGAKLFLRAKDLPITARAMQWPDALGMGLFAASGTQLALQLQVPAIVAVLMGVVTAVFGGVLRDVVCNEIPSAFADHRPYAVCAFAGGWVLVGALALGLPQGSALLVAAGTATGLRVLALLTDWRLPQWSSGEEPRG